MLKFPIEIFSKFQWTTKQSFVGHQTSACELSWVYP